MPRAGKAVAKFSSSHHCSHKDRALPCLFNNSLFHLYFIFSNVLLSVTMDTGASPSRVTSSRVVPEAKVIGVATQRKRVPYLNFLPDAVRNHFIAMCGEFTGTFLFLFFAFSGTQVANSQTQGTVSTTIAQGSNPAQLLYISLCFGFSLAVTAWVFFRISGGLFNPAVGFLDDTNA